MTVVPSVQAGQPVIRPDLVQQYRTAQSARDFGGLQGLHYGEAVLAIGEGAISFLDTVDEVPVLHAERLFG